MQTADVLGYAAASLVLLTFCMRSMRALRCTAIASNVLFILYAAWAWLPPVGALHMLLLPLNIWHLWHGHLRNTQADADVRPEHVRPRPPTAALRTRRRRVAMTRRLRPLGPVRHPRGMWRSKAQGCSDHPP